MDVLSGLERRQSHGFCVAAARKSGKDTKIVRQGQGQAGETDVFTPQGHVKSSPAPGAMLLLERKSYQECAGIRALSAQGHRLCA